MTATTAIAFHTPYTKAELIRHLGNIATDYDITDAQADRIAARVMEEAPSRGLDTLEAAEHRFSEIWENYDWWVLDL